MKIFNKTAGWCEKVNFVDVNNVVLGYDMGQSCCEHADWFIADKPTEAILDRKNTPDGTPEEMPGWVFDPAYRKDVKDIREAGSEWNQLDEGGMVIFRIVKDGAEKFIHLFNCHNGYYGHGFDFDGPTGKICEGGL
jgi:hypothetical protein